MSNFCSGHDDRLKAVILSFAPRTTYSGSHRWTSRRFRNYVASLMVLKGYSAGRTKKEKKKRGCLNRRFETLVARTLLY